MFDNQNPLLNPGGVAPPVQTALPGQMQANSQQNMAPPQPAAHSPHAANPFDSQTLGGMTVQQVLDQFQSGGHGMMGGFRNALMGVMHPQGSGPGGWLQGLGMFHQQGQPGSGPVMTPGGGGGGGPPQGVGMVPGVPGSMGTNPAAAPVPQNYQLPNY